MTDVIDALRFAEAVDRLISAAQASGDPSRRTMAQAVRTLARRSYELEPKILGRSLTAAERLEGEAVARQWLDGIRWLIDHKEPIQ